MADINIRIPDCDDNERGRRGRRGRRGPAGSGVGGLLKFSGVVTADPQGPGTISYLGDSGTEGATAQDDPLGYPVAVARSLRNMAVNIFSLVVPQTGLLVIELLQNATVVATITYVPGETGIKTVLFGPTPYAVGDTLDLRIATTNLTPSPDEVELSATVGVE